MARNPQSLARLNTILKRQVVATWGPDYEPSIKATKAEAPKLSTATILNYEPYGHRDIHCLSWVEAVVALLALYSQYTWYLKEQPMLPTTPCAHPLSTHPRAEKLQLPGLKGTVLIAEELGYLDIHRYVWDGDTAIPFPFIADFLLFLTDDAGPYCKNWNVKAHIGDHWKPGSELFGTPFRGRNRSPSEAQLRAAAARYEIEEATYGSGAIRTQAVSVDVIGQHLRENLYRLFLWHKGGRHFPTSLVVGCVRAFEAGMATGEPPIETVRRLMFRYRRDRDDILRIFYQAIWSRRVCPDLVRGPLCIDFPLTPETSHPLAPFTEWFAR